MTDSARRALSYIAVGLITHSLAAGLYDPTMHRHYNFQGSVGPKGINLHSVEDHVDITGHYQNGKWGVELNRTHERFELMTANLNFAVYDFHAHLHYRGIVSLNQVSLNQENSQEQYHYSYTATP